MKTIVKKIATIACAVLVSTAIPATISGNTDSGVFSTISASAASEVKQCYLIENANQTVYVSRNCSGTKVGTVYGTDLINVYEVHDDACYIGYPTSKGEKKGWIKTNLILLGTGGSTVKSKGRFTVYKRASTSSGSFGAVYTNDSTKIIGEKNNMVQVKYPTSNGYKYAWATKNNAQTYLGYGYSSQNNNSNVSQPYVYQQKSGSWSSYSYGWYYDNSGKKVNATIGSSGCGIVSFTNAIKNLNGNFVDPTIIAKYSLDNGFRINNVGTSYGLYQSFCNNRGSNYGIKFITNTKSYSTLSTYLSQEKVAIIHVPGHIMACTAYSNGKYLIVDSSANSSRGTESGYAWKTEQQMKNMGVESDFYIIGKR